nr:RNA-directed DNA polymerase, eukaryota [Tanacetum cinerariifolium]
MANIIDFTVKALWGTMSFDFASILSRGRSGVSQGFLDLFSNISGLILHRNISDHSPILLKESLVDYSPTPFRLFHSWFLEDDFISVVQDSWSIADNNSQNHMIKLKNKLKNLKHRLKAWSCDKKYLHNKERNLIQESLLGIDLCLDQGVGLPNDVLNRSKLVRELDDLNKKESIDLAQKAKVKWAIEGDENSKFYHGIVKKKRYLAIKGILMEDWYRVPLVDQFPRVLSLDLSRNLEAVKYRSILGNDVILAVKEFFSTGSIPNGCNPSFIALIPKVLDAKLLNDFRPISLVGCQYNIIGKILTNRLSYVMDDLISQEQFAFVKGRQIMKGPT